MRPLTLRRVASRLKVARIDATYILDVIVAVWVGFFIRKTVKLRLSQRRCNARRQHHRKHRNNAPHISSQPRGDPRWITSPNQHRNGLSDSAGRTDEQNLALLRKYSRKSGGHRKGRSCCDPAPQTSGAVLLRVVGSGYRLTISRVRVGVRRPGVPPIPHVKPQSDAEATVIASMNATATNTASFSRPAPKLVD